MCRVRRTENDSRGCPGLGRFVRGSLALGDLDTSQGEGREGGKLMTSKAIPIADKRSEWKALADFWKGKDAGQSNYYQRLYDGTHDEYREHMRDILHRHDGHRGRKVIRK